MKLPISRFTVNGNSMVPTLYPGQDVLSFNWAYIGRKPAVGEIIVLNLNGRDLIKRVTSVNGEQVFVEGDNKAESTDSRDFGAVSLDNVIGKVIYIDSHLPASRHGFRGNDMVDCPKCGSALVGIYGRKDAICRNCGFKLSCCGEP